MKFISDHWEGTIAIIALMTSIISTIISFYTFRLQRAQNVKSVRPIIHVGQWDYENRLFVTLKNVGYGIAIVKRMSMINSKGESKSCIYDWLPNKLPDDMNYKEYWTPYTEFVVQAGEVIKLIELPIDTTKPGQLEVRERIRRILGQLCPIDSLKNIQKFWFPKDGSHTIIDHFDIQPLNIYIDGDTAVSTGISILDWRYEKDAVKFEVNQKGIETTVYRRQKDNTWKVWRQMWTDLYSKKTN